MKNNINIRFIIIFILVILVTVIITGYFRKRYINYLPTIPVYPNSYIEVKKVEEEVSTITSGDIEFYKSTDTILMLIKIGLPIYNVMVSTTKLWSCSQCKCLICFH